MNVIFFLIDWNKEIKSNDVCLHLSKNQCMFNNKYLNAFWL